MPLAGLQEGHLACKKSAPGSLKDNKHPMNYAPDRDQ